MIMMVYSQNSVPPNISAGSVSDQYFFDAIYPLMALIGSGT